MAMFFAVVYSSKYNVDIGPHVMRTEKYRLVMNRLLEELKLNSREILEPKTPADGALKSALDASYYDDLKNARQTWRTISSELPISRTIIETAFLCVGGTILAAEEALHRHGIIFHDGGGWHHAFPNHSEGFCYVNDVAVAVQDLKRRQMIRRAMVVDLDLHQGNGTAVYFQNDPDVFTFSMHQDQLYPQKQRSDLDIPLVNFTTDSSYMRLLSTAIPRIYDEHQPDIIFYIAGADPYMDDQLGSLSLTIEGLRKRDEVVLSEAANRQIPVVITLAGGYAIDLKDTVEIHVNTAKVAHEIAARYQAPIPAQ